MMPAQKTTLNPSKTPTLAGSSLPRREPLLRTLQRLKVNPSTISAEVARFITVEAPVPLGRYQKKLAVDIRDLDHGADNEVGPAAKIPAEQRMRFQRTAFEDCFKKKIESTVDSRDGDTRKTYSTHADLDSAFAVQTFKTARETNHHRFGAPWWFRDPMIFQRLFDRWMSEAKNIRDRREAELNRAVLHEWYGLGLHDGEIFRRHAADFKQIRRKSRYVRSAKGLTTYRKRLMDEGNTFFFDPDREAEPLLVEEDPTWRDWRRAKRELWRPVRERRNSEPPRKD